eukprot:15464956-Alexandrium_andersonii.AAC.1
MVLALSVLGTTRRRCATRQLLMLIGAEGLFCCSVVETPIEWPPCACSHPRWPPRRTCREAAAKSAAATSG